MPYFPVFLDLRDRRCVVVGGGRVAAGKVSALLRAEARVRLVSPSVEDDLSRLASEGRIDWIRRPFEAVDLEGAFLAIAATDDDAVNRGVAEEARRAGILVNAVDQIDHCDFIAPAVLDRGLLQVAVSTSGAAPALAARARDRIAEVIGPEFEKTADLLASLRRRLREAGVPSEDRQAFFRRLADSDLVERVRREDWPSVRDLLDYPGAPTQGGIE